MLRNYCGVESRIPFLRIPPDRVASRMWMIVQLFKLHPPLFFLLLRRTRIVATRFESNSRTIVPSNETSDHFSRYRSFFIAIDEGRRDNSWLISKSPRCHIFFFFLFLNPLWNSAKGERIFGFSNRGVLILLFDLKVESKCCASQKQRVVIVFFESEKFHVFGGETFFSKRKKTKRNSCDVSSSKFLHSLVSSSLSLSFMRLVLLFSFL